MKKIIILCLVVLTFEVSKVNAQALTYVDSLDVTYDISGDMIDMMYHINSQGADSLTFYLFGVDFLFKIKGAPFWNNSGQILSANQNTTGWFSHQENTGLNAGDSMAFAFIVYNTYNDTNGNVVSNIDTAFFEGQVPLSLQVIAIYPGVTYVEVINSIYSLNDSISIYTELFDNSGNVVQVSPTVNFPPTGNQPTLQSVMFYNLSPFTSWFVMTYTENLTTHITDNTQPMWFTTGFTTGLEDIDLQTSVYPNPTFGEVNISAGSKEVSKYELYSVSGKLQKTELIQGNEKIYFNEISAGVYFLKLYFKDKVSTLKLIKI